MHAPIIHVRPHAHAGERTAGMFDACSRSSGRGMLKPPVETLEVCFAVERLARTTPTLSGERSAARWRSHGVYGQSHAAGAAGTCSSDWSSSAAMHGRRVAVRSGHPIAWTVAVGRAFARRRAASPAPSGCCQGSCWSGTTRLPTIGNVGGYIYRLSSRWHGHAVLGADLIISDGLSASAVGQGVKSAAADVVTAG